VLVLILVWFVNSTDASLTELTRALRVTSIPLAVGFLSAYSAKSGLISGMIRVPEWTKIAFTSLGSTLE
jgi:hypothetical protein